MRAPVPLVSALDAALNRVLQLDPHAAERVRALEGKLLALHIRGPNMTLYLLPVDGRLQVHAFAEGHIDTTISATPLGLARLALATDSSDAMFKGEVKIVGDVAFGQAVKDLLGNIDIDWEELLSNVIGDIAAHQVGRGVRGLKNWGQHAAASLQQDLAELLQQEMRVLPQRVDIEQFLDDVDALRADVERFELRLSRYEQRINNNNA
ncbi:SCP2 domain-containing protein [Sulfuriflexus sp.]|uniref:ubiquinone biosynthesis accessory factor UbiJ n=1 Tax=Sulfuriflexus sp. TaxID=2015443 RepID=UPI0028CD5239|nr:SCP2 sterol-binding domain-containing protein [Sulfuriflexus sp.]MDT8405015.1 SCP2 sterol-binding domain-containing protein [Sulfuriflexus sp.]